MGELDNAVNLAAAKSFYIRSKSSSHSTVMGQMFTQSQLFFSSSRNVLLTSCPQRTFLFSTSVICYMHASRSFNLTAGKGCRSKLAKFSVWCYAVNQGDSNYVCHMTTRDAKWGNVRGAHPSALCNGGTCKVSVDSRPPIHPQSEKKWACVRSRVNLEESFDFLQATRWRCYQPINMMAQLWSSMEEAEWTWLNNFTGLHFCLTKTNRESSILEKRNRMTQVNFISATVTW